MVSSLVDTQEPIVIEPRAEVRSLSRRHLFWAIPLAVLGFLAVVCIAVAAFSRATLVASKRDFYTAQPTSLHGSPGPSEEVQYAVVPADAQPVEPRLSIEGPTTYDSNGQVLFVTVRTPELSMLEWWVRRTQGPAVDPRRDSRRSLCAVRDPGQQTQAL